MVSRGLDIQNGDPNARKEAKRRKGKKRKHGVAAGGAAADADGRPSTEARTNLLATLPRTVVGAKRGQGGSGLGDRVSRGDDRELGT